jgi:hypothetical protein
MANDNASLTTHILPTSATLVGACITALSVTKAMHHGSVMVDKLLALDTALFLVSAILSFIAMRSPRLERRMESFAEAIFLFALVLVAVAAVALSIEVR